MTSYAAFFRNLNLGRPNCPTRSQFEAAFIDAGAASAQSFLVNGTMVFSAGSDPKARKLLAAACRGLRTDCGLIEPAFLRRVDTLADMVAVDPFTGVDRDSVYDCCVTFLQAADALLPPDLPRRSTRGDVEVIGDRPGAVYSIVRKIGNTPGSPNAVLERALGQPATTRTWNTVVRLIAKHA